MLADAAAKQPIPWSEIQGYLSVYGGLAIVLAAPTFLLWRTLTPRLPILPSQRVRLVPWSVFETALAFVIYMTWLGAFAIAFRADDKTLPDRYLRQLGAILAAFPFQLGFIILALYKFAEVQPYQFGLIRKRLSRDLVAGFLTWLVIVPVAFSVFVAVSYEWGPEKHPIQKIIHVDRSWYIWLGTIVSAVIFAPIMEEVIFRGLVQPLLVLKPLIADIIILGSMITVVTKADNLGWVASISWMVALGGGYLAFEFVSRYWLPRPGAARAIFVTSLMFAASHNEVWPTPIPLFALAVGLGFLAYRTQSIVGPIVVHALFNLVSILQLMIQPD